MQYAIAKAATSSCTISHMGEIIGFTWKCSSNQITLRVSMAERLWYTTNHMQINPLIDIDNATYNGSGSTSNWIPHQYAWYRHYCPLTLNLQCHFLRAFRKFISYFTGVICFCFFYIFLASFDSRNTIY